MALDREYQVHRTEAIGNVREGWRDMVYSRVENRHVAELWLRGNAQELEDQVELFQFELMTREMLRMIDQNFSVFSAVQGEPADWAVEQLVDTENHPFGSPMGGNDLGPTFDQQIEITGGIALAEHHFPAQVLVLGHDLADRV